MSFNTRKRNPIGPRFGELMGKHCHAALTAAARGKRAEYDREVADIYQMLDTVEQETNWNDTDTPAVVAPESKPAPKSASPESTPKKRAKASGSASKRSRSADKGTSSDGSADGPGDGSEPASK